ncbi:MAG TPA: hypothetical protein VFB93_12910 [Burkholderiales bacterium]|nr:hypothetical protein [Burkholderiales bacterium]
MENYQETPKPALQLLALLALASALGVASAIVLAGLAMLLAAPAYAEEGRLLLERPGGLARAELLFVESESHENGHLRVVEAYHNPFGEPLIGIYLYRLPLNAVLEHLSFSRGAAEPCHALLTQREGATLVERTTEIGPGETLVIELEYRSRLAPRRLLAQH